MVGEPGQEMEVDYSTAMMEPTGVRMIGEPGQEMEGTRAALVQPDAFAKPALARYPSVAINRRASAGPIKLPAACHTDRGVEDCRPGLSRGNAVPYARTSSI